MGSLTIRIGWRTLLAASCVKCGHLFDGEKYRRHRRNRRDRAAYLDMRCPSCKWGAKLHGNPATS